MTFINRNNMYKQRSFTSGVIGNIEAEIDRYRSILSDPASISTLEDYKYHVGVIAGLDIALELFNRHIIEVNNND
ncbi:MAG: hypothetical protein H6910_04810 [Rickettsiaceae bacterium]|nr:hypothetical protein [Rickettsiaceae bacterium]MCP5378420.1 hypothetical protein [Rickettsiaceae bacterium]